MLSETDSFHDLRARFRAQPDDPELLYACYAAAETTAPDDMIALLEERLEIETSGAQIRLNALHALARLREKQGRTAAGLPLANAVDIRDLTFRYAQADLVRLAQESAAFLHHHRQATAAAILLAESLTSLGDYRQAEHVFSQLRRIEGPDPVHVATFDSDFHAALPSYARQSLTDFPPLLMTREIAPDTERLVFTAGDYLYFQKFGWEFVESLAQHGHGTHLHLHVYDITQDEIAATCARLKNIPDLRWSLSSEWTDLRGGEPARARGYYHAIRFIRAWQLLVEYKQPAWMIDMDTIFHADTTALFELLSGHDLALYIFPGRFETRNKVMATCLGAAPTQDAHDYLRDVAGYIGHYYKKNRLVWGIDQIALCTTLAMRPTDASPRIACIPETICDGTRGMGQVLWPAKTV